MSDRSRPPDDFAGDRRGSSTTLTHVLTLGLTVVLISGLVFAGGALSESQREQAAQAGLKTVGERTVSELVRVDSFVADGNHTVVSLRTEHAETIAGHSYVVELSTDPTQCGSPPCLRLRTANSGVEVTLALVVETPVAPSSVSGGNFRIVFDGSSLSLEPGVPA
jgi:hypothetical protein